MKKKDLRGKSFSTVYLLSLMLLLHSCGNMENTEEGLSEASVVPEERIGWWLDAKFGMFIHWGPYAVLGGEWKGEGLEEGQIAEWIMKWKQIPVEEYREVAAGFNPTGFNAKQWVELAKNTGMKYMVITSKHHDGFAMYDSRVSSYNIVDHAPFGRDVIRELSEACVEAGFRFGIYYSHREDWDHPYAYGNTWDFDSSQTNLDTMDHPELFRRYLDEKAIPQLKELLTDYGPMSVVWFDRGMYSQEQGREFADLVHLLQPNCLVNGRVGHYYKELLGDYQSLNDNGMPPGGIEEYWETPQTLNDTWGYDKSDENWKDPREIILRLVSIVSNGGNYLLNVGPTGEGHIPQPSVDILNQVGKWMNTFSESIYGTSASPFPYELPWGYCTMKEEKLYLHVFQWPGDGSIELWGLNNKVKKAYMMVKPGVELNVSNEGENALSITLPETAKDDINTVVVLEIWGPPDVDPIIIEQEPGEPVVLDYLTASTSGKAIKRFNRKGEDERFHISKMQGPGDVIQWQVNIQKPGVYDVRIRYAAIPEWEGAAYIIDAGKSRIKGSVRSSDGWYEYKTEDAGQLKIKRKGVQTIRLYPEHNLDNYLMYFNSLELKAK
ncbi:MAG: alpha-L-fucosidase [Bacteroidota bacterium]